MNKKVRAVGRIAFTLIEIAVFILLLVDSISDFIPSHERNILCYVAVIFAAIIAFVFTPKDEYKNKGFLLLSYIFIIVADYFLLFTESAIGIYFFIGAQICFQLFISKVKLFPLLLIIEVLVIGIMCLIIFTTSLKDSFDLALTIPALVYYVALIFNIISSIVVYRKEKGLKYLVTLSLVFLFFCDTSIGLSNITSISIFNELIWLFYIICHILLGNYLTLKCEKEILKP